MTTIYYDDTYPEQFAEAVRALADRDPSLLDRLKEGPRTSGQLECQLRVDPQERIAIFNMHAEGLSSQDPEVVLAAAAAFTEDKTYLDNKAKAYKTCQGLRPPLYRTSGR